MKLYTAFTVYLHVNIIASEERNPIFVLASLPGRGGTSDFKRRKRSKDFLEVEIFYFFFFWGGGGGEIWQVFFGWPALSRDFLGYTKQSEESW